MARKLIKEEFIRGETFYGFEVEHIFSTVRLNKFQSSYQLKSYILFPDLTPIIVNKSEQLMSNFSLYMLSINSTIESGKFVYNPINGDFYFEIASNYSNTNVEAQKWQKDIFVMASHKAISFHLPRILFAAGLITTTEIIAIEAVECAGNNLKVRQMKPEVIALIKYLDVFAYNALKATGSSDFADRKLGGTRAGITYRIATVPKAVYEYEENVYKYIDKVITSGLNTNQPGFGDFGRFEDWLAEEQKILGATAPNERIQQAEADRFICSKVSINSSVPEHKIMEVPRLCNLTVAYGVCEFTRNGQKPANKRCNLLSAKFPEAELAMAQNAKMILEYFMAQSNKLSFHINILPNSLKENGSLLDGFYSEFIKHGTIENFITNKRNTLKFLLLVIKSILNAEAFFYQHHNIVHLDTQLYNVYINRIIQTKLAFINKAFVLDDKKLKEMGYQSGHKQYKQTYVGPTNYMQSAKEIFQDNGIVSDKTVVYNMANIVMQTIFESKPQTKKKVSEATTLERLKEGKFAIGYTPVDLATKGSIEVLEPLHVFTRACLELDDAKRPSLMEMGVFISLCLRCIDHIYC